MISIGVAVHSEPTPRLREFASRFAAALPRDGVRLLLGGYWGAMKFVADEALGRGIEVVFLLPLDPPARPPREDLFVPIDTGMDYKGRSVVLVRSSDALAALGGESGTMLEILMAYSMGIPAVVLRSGMPTDGLEGLGEYPDSRRIPGAGLRFVGTPEELAEASLEVAIARVS